MLHQPLLKKQSFFFKYTFNSKLGNKHITFDTEPRRNGSESRHYNEHISYVWMLCNHDKD